jgi:hypothetical protein
MTRLRSAADRVLARMRLAGARIVEQRLSILVALVLGLACLSVPIVALYLRGEILCPSQPTPPDRCYIR